MSELQRPGGSRRDGAVILDGPAHLATALVSVRRARANERRRTHPRRRRSYRDPGGGAPTGTVAASPYQLVDGMFYTINDASADLFELVDCGVHGHLWKEFIDGPRRAAAADGCACPTCWPEENPGARRREDLTREKAHAEANRFFKAPPRPWKRRPLSMPVASAAVPAPFTPRERMRAYEVLGHFYATLAYSQRVLHRAAIAAEEAEHPRA